MRPYLETLFRRPLLLILPALILPAIIFVATKAMPTTYRVSATLWVDRATTSSPNPAAPVRTASAQETIAFRDRMTTQSFRNKVIVDAQLGPAVEAYEWPEPQPPGSWLAGFPPTRPIAKVLKGTKPVSKEAAWKRAGDVLFQSLQIREEGANLITVTYVGTDNEAGEKLVRAATTAFLAEKTGSIQRKLDESSGPKERVIAAVQAETDAARQAYQDFQANLPAAPTRAQQQRLSELELAYTQASSRLQQLKVSQAESALSTLSSWTDQSPNLLVVDAPGGPAVKAHGMRYAFVLAFFGGCLGLMLGGALVVFRTWMDQTLRVSEDVALRLKAPIVDALPLLKGGGARSGTW